MFTIIYENSARTWKSSEETHATAKKAEAAVLKFYSLNGGVVTVNGTELFKQADAFAFFVEYPETKAAKQAAKREANDFQRQGSWSGIDQ